MELYSPELSQQITKWGLHDAGFSYDIVAVFSTGKSESRSLSLSLSLSLSHFLRLLGGEADDASVPLLCVHSSRRVGLFVPGVVALSRE
jgi:hypothetical protein